MEICTCKDPYTSDIVHTDDEGCCMECGEQYVVQRYSHLQDFEQVAKDKARWRKERPLATGVLAYFPDALLEVAHASWVGNNQHNFGQPLHWTREKSTDQLDAALRHITDHLKGEQIDSDGCYHLSKACWRILAHLQITLEEQNAKI